MATPRNEKKNIAYKHVTYAHPPSILLLCIQRSKPGYSTD